MTRPTAKTYDNLGILSGNVPTLLPTTMLPVQLHEPGDIQLAREAIESGQLIGLALGEDVNDDIGALAQIVDYTELHDGRVLLLLKGIERIRFLGDAKDAVDASSFRTVRAEQLIGGLPDRAHELQLRHAILGTLLALASFGIEGADMIHDQAIQVRDLDDFADFVGARIMLHPTERRGLLREIDTVARLTQVEERLGNILVQRSLMTDVYEWVN